MNVIAPVVGTNTIRYADFVRITTASATYRFSTAPTAITVSAVDASAFTGLSQLVSIGSVTRDIKSTANETTVTLVGIDTAMLSLVLGAGIKGSEIEMWHGFFDAEGILISNLLTYSQNFTTYLPWATGTNLGSFFTTQTSLIQDPFGTFNATKFTATATTSQGLFLRYAVPLTANTYDVSIYVYVPSQVGITDFRISFDNDTTASLSNTSTLFNQWVRLSAKITQNGSQFLDFNLLVNGTTAPSSGFIVNAFGAQAQTTGLSSYTPTNATSNSGLYQYFNGYINSFSISEQWMEEIRGYVGTVTVSASSIQLILQNRTAGRYTNDNAWKQFAPTDTSMNRVNFIQTINYQFGKNAPPNS